MLSKSVCQKLVEKNVDGIVLVDSDGVVQFANPAAEKLFGMALEGSLFGYPAVAGESTEVDILHCDLGPRTAELRAVEFGSNKDVKQILISLRDLTQRVHLEQELRRARDIAERATQAKNRFLGNLSHELRTPLNAVIGFSGLLLDGSMGTLNAEQREYLHDVLNSGRELLYLVNNLLDFADSEAEDLPVQSATFNLKTFLATHLSNIRDQAREKGILIDVNWKDAPESIYSDKHLLGGVLDQLLFNAVKFTPEHGSIQITACRVASNRNDEPDFLQISIKDCGLGIDPQNLERIFQPFEQEDNSSRRLFGGLGMGLALARKSLNCLGGRIWAESQGRDLGSIFHIMIPVKTAVSPQS
ncbi:MAG: PAS domain-containing protein [Magnetococcales bacterium]|nr:PAS domain-containing protein [Magnetococcales bacterium]